MNIDRFSKDFKAIARFGRLENGGVTRLAFSKEDLGARTYLIRAMETAGLEVRIDPVGNIRGTRPGTKNLPPVLAGSHLDTVPWGGHFDGVIGVLGALEMVRTMNDRSIVTKRPVEVVNFSCEESSRFGISTVGSKVLAGRLGSDDLKKATDKDGISIYQALGKSGYAPDQAGPLKEKVHAFIELHIEQGPVLEHENCQVGIVTAIAGPTRFKVSICGRADHSGTTPMNLRKDALAGASEVILGVEKIASFEAGEKTVATVGVAHILPGSMNVVPGQVDLGIDLRDICKSDKDGAVKKILALLDRVRTKRGLEIACEMISDEAPVPLSENIIALLEQEAGNAGLGYEKLPSGAGHDAMNMAKITDAGMIFIPSIKGISHNIVENSRFSDIAAGCALLYAAVTRLADQEDSFENNGKSR
ncbi:MAG: M20 family metallo-hydrolase [Proteobacteria bacterium]|nr:M20 family metallo-hydrolase [Desulfobacula sp.]MBU4130074.1 M20 family metallo-hydrolase [Pseudomonadota bacterium]